MPFLRVRPAGWGISTMVLLLLSCLWLLFVQLPSLNHRGTMWLSGEFVPDQTVVAGVHPLLTAMSPHLLLCPQVHSLLKPGIPRLDSWLSTWLSLCSTVVLEPTLFLSLNKTPRGDCFPRGPCTKDMDIKMEGQGWRHITITLAL